MTESVKSKSLLKEKSDLTKCGSMGPRPTHNSTFYFLSFGTVNASQRRASSSPLNGTELSLSWCHIATSRELHMEPQLALFSGSGQGCHCEPVEFLLTRVSLRRPSSSVCPLSSFRGRNDSVLQVRRHEFYFIFYSVSTINLCLLVCYCHVNDLSNIASKRISWHKYLKMPRDSRCCSELVHPIERKTVLGDARHDLSNRKSANCVTDSTWMQSGKSPRSTNSLQI